MRKNILRISLCIMIILISGTSAFAVDKAAFSYNDIGQSDWFAKYIIKLNGLGVLNGYEDITFKPNKAITKAEFIVLVLNAINSKEEISEDEHWAMNYIRKAKSLKILDDVETEESALDINITRFEAVKILVNVIEITGENDFNNDNITIQDFNTIPDTYKDYVVKGYKEGLIAGYPNGEFRGNNSLTRAEASLAILRAIDAESEIQIRQEEEKRSGIVNTAIKLLGIPYVWGGTSPSGLDSSGLIWYTFKQNGINIPRVSFDIYKYGKKISKSELQPGDLVFFEGYKPGPSHGSIYIGNDQFVHSPTVGKTVSIGNLNDPYYWGPNFYGAVRIIE